MRGAPAHPRWLTFRLGHQICFCDDAMAAIEVRQKLSPAVAAVRHVTTSASRRPQVGRGDAQLRTAPDQAVRRLAFQETAVL
jgi:hypothetical protein